MECTGHGNDFELIPMVKMETTNPVDGSVRRSVIIAELRQPEVTRHHFLKIFAFFGKTTAYPKISKILFRKFSSRHRSTSCVQILADGKSVKSCVAYPTKNNFISLSSCRYCMDSTQNLPWLAIDNAVK